MKTVNLLNVIACFGSIITISMLIVYAPKKHEPSIEELIKSELTVQSVLITSPDDLNYVSEAIQNEPNCKKISLVAKLKNNNFVPIAHWIDCLKPNEMGPKEKDLIVL